MGLVWATSTTTKIKNSQKNIYVNNTAKKKTNRQLNKIAKDIISAEKDIVYMEKKIDQLAKNQKKSEEEYTKLKEQLRQSEKDFSLTTKSLEKKNANFVALLSKQFSIVFAMEKTHEATRKSIISQEIYQIYKAHNEEALKELKSDIKLLKREKSTIISLHNKTKNKIKRIVAKKKEYAKRKLAKEKLRKRLRLYEEKYNNKLARLEDRQNSLRSTLAKLNILHKKEVDKARKEAFARKEAMRLEKKRKREIRKAQALARKNARKAQEIFNQATTEEGRAKARKAIKQAKKAEQKVYKSSDKVRQVNSSYTQPKTYAYRGGKTISPMRGARVIKNFGTYIDPIYKIKIFNESITLKAPFANAKVHNVLNGKVVFSGKSSMLGRVVVVAHSGKMHTVYAGLSKIAPTIRVGSKIQRGYVLGKVSSKLIFQATKNSKHINPLKLIRI